MPDEHRLVTFMDQIRVNLKLLYSDCGTRGGSHALHAMALLLESAKSLKALIAATTIAAFCLRDSTLTAFLSLYPSELDNCVCLYSVCVLHCVLFAMYCSLKGVWPLVCRKICTVCLRTSAILALNSDLLVTYLHQACSAPATLHESCICSVSVPSLWCGK